MSTVPILYPAQAEGVQWALSAPKPLRRTLAWATGCGKTAGAISIAEAVGAERILVVCPAIVRRHWAHELVKWWPTRFRTTGEVGVIEWGPRRNLTAEKTALRERAYTCPVQVVSYELCAYMQARDWDMVIIDELHNLGNPTSKQSKCLRALVKHNPRAHVIGLSATLVPTDVHQLWHPQHLLHGATWGRPSRTGGISWGFIYEYLHVVANEWGKAPGPLREDRREALMQKLGHVCHRLTRVDILADCDPIDVMPLYVEKLDLGVFNDWLSGLAEDTTHAVIFTYHKELCEHVMHTARIYAARYPDTCLECITGETPVAARHAILERVAQAPRGILVATMGSLAEGVRLTWAQRVLVSEFRQSPGTMAQLFGRFSSVGSQARPKVEVVVPDADTMAAGHLLQRLADINAVIRGGAGEAAIQSTFKPRALTAERVEGMFAAMLADFNPDKGAWQDDADAPQYTQRAT
jgi:hypothetical protein